MRGAVLAVAVVAVLAAVLGIGVRGTFGAHVAVDETQYLLTALSLAEDGDLDLSDELAARRWEVFADVEPPVQTSLLPGGRQVSPHDPLLPVLLAVPMGLGGWVAAKAALALLAGALAALTLWVAVRRFAVPLPLATVGVGLGAASAPLAVYGQQVYPELPAALATMVGIAALLTPDPASRSSATGATTRRWSLLLVGAAVVALPWLSVKYVPVAAALAGLAAVRWWRDGRRTEVAGFGAALAAMGAVYLAVHRAVWGGWTVYASGDHFEQTGQFSVVGVDPNYLGRSVRLVGLLVDREFGIATWQPAWLLLVAAAAFLLARRPAGWGALLVPPAVGWLVATFVALTMHGFWWPGRQLVVVLPLALLAVLVWLSRCGPVARGMALLLGVAGVLNYVALLVDGYAREITWVSGFPEVAPAPYQLLRPLLPDYRAEFLVAHLGWIGVLGLLAVVGWSAARRTPAATARQRRHSAHTAE